MLGKLLQKLGAPGFVRPIDYSDPVTGQRIKIRTSPLYTILSVDAKEFFFLRETGKFDGTGAMSLGDATALNYCRAERIRRSAGPPAAGGMVHLPE